MLRLLKKFFTLSIEGGPRFASKQALHYLAGRHGTLYSFLIGKYSFKSALGDYYRRGGVRLLMKASLILVLIAVAILINLIVGNSVTANSSRPTRMDIVYWHKTHGKPVTVVIPTYNDVKLTQQCLEAIYKNTDPKKVKVIVVDDGSSKEIQQSLLKLEGTFPSLKIICAQKNQGFAVTCNTGLKISTTDIVLLNNDTEVNPGWLAALQYCAYSSKDIGVVGPKLLYPNGLIQFGGTFRNFNAPQWFDHSYRMRPSSYGPANIEKDVLAVTGACMYIKKEVLDEVGNLDGAFKMAFEDVDYCLRVWRAGYRVRYCPDATVIHHESLTRGKIQGKREIDSLNYFWRKWRQWFDQRNVRDDKGNINVVYVLQDTGVAGGHRIVFEHLNRLNKISGFNVKLYALAGKPNWFPLEVPVRKFNDYQQLFKVLAQEEAIKVATWWETADPVWRASLQKGIPVFFVQDIESSYYDGDKRAQDTVIAHYRPEFYYLTTSGWNEGQLQALNMHAKVVSCGLDTDLYRLKSEVKRRSDVLLALGRKHYLKNLNMTLQALRLIKKRIFKFWLFGTEPDIKDQYPDLVDKYVYRPTDEEVVNLYNQATVFVQTSRHEGFCLPILEAMASGVPVICTDADGNRDFCVNGENCLVVPQDDHRALARSLLQMFSDGSLRKRLAKNGLLTAREYAWEKIAQQLAKFFTEIADSQSLRGGKI